MCSRLIVIPSVLECKQPSLSVCLLRYCLLLACIVCAFALHTDGYPSAFWDRARATAHHTSPQLALVSASFMFAQPHAVQACEAINSVHPLFVVQYLVHLVSQALVGGENGPSTEGLRSMLSSIPFFLEMVDKTLERLPERRTIRRRGANLALCAISSRSTMFAKERSSTWTNFLSGGWRISRLARRIF